LASLPSVAATPVDLGLLIRDLGSLSDGGLDTITRLGGGELYRLGSLSTNEINVAVKKLRLRNVSVVVLFQADDRAFLDASCVDVWHLREHMASLPEGHACVILLVERKHYITIFRYQRRLNFYDPLGRPFHYYFQTETFRDLRVDAVDSDIRQGLLNTTCGLYCLCQLWSVYKCGSFLSRWLSTTDVFQRDYMILLFSFSFGITPPELAQLKDVGAFLNEIKRVQGTELKRSV
jgi:hypothetical protein